MNYQRNSMRYRGMQTPGMQTPGMQTPGVVNNGQNITEPQYGRRPMNNGGCGCCEGGGGNGTAEIDCLRGKSLAMVYSPCQEFEDLYDHTEGLRRGTIFRALDKPFTGRRGGC